MSAAVRPTTWSRGSDSTALVTPLRRIANAASPHASSIVTMAMTGPAIKPTRNSVPASGNTFVPTPAVCESSATTVAPCAAAPNDDVAGTENSSLKRRSATGRAPLHALAATNSSNIAPTMLKKTSASLSRSTTNDARSPALATSHFAPRAASIASRPPTTAQPMMTQSVKSTKARPAFSVTAHAPTTPAARPASAKLRAPRVSVSAGFGVTVGCGAALRASSVVAVIGIPLRVLVLKTSTLSAARAACALGGMLEAVLCRFGAGLVSL